MFKPIITPKLRKSTKKTTLPNGHFVLGLKNMKFNKAFLRNVIQTDENVKNDPVAYFTIANGTQGTVLVCNPIVNNPVNYVSPTVVRDVSQNYELEDTDLVLLMSKQPFALTTMKCFNISSIGVSNSTAEVIDQFIGKYGREIPTSSTEVALRDSNGKLQLTPNNEPIFVKKATYNKAVFECYAVAVVTSQVDANAKSPIYALLFKLVDASQPQDKERINLTKTLSALSIRK
jgi:hypothetical protein